VNHFPLFLFIVSFLYINCSQKYSLTRESLPFVGNSPPDSPKLGLAILQNVQKEKLPHTLLLQISETIFNAQENLKKSDWKPNQRIEWIPTYVEGTFGDTQDYLSITKKNILEIHTTLTYKSGLGSEVFHALTFSLIPSTFDYNLQMKSYFYDSHGVCIELMTAESFPIVDKYGMLVDHDALDYNAEQQIQARLADLIQRSFSKIQDKNISHNNFEPIDMVKFINPFLLSIDYISCYDNYSFEYGVGIRSTLVFDNKEYSLCTSEIRFLNHQERYIPISSIDFFLISKNDQINTLESIPDIYTHNRGNGNSLKRKTTRDLTTSIILNASDKLSEESMELFFMLPKNFDKSNVRLRWKSPDSEQLMVEGWIGEIEVK
jgi:hypothetical protein